MGVRHILDLEPRPKYLELEEVAAGVRALHRHDMTFDLLLRWVERGFGWVWDDVVRVSGGDG